MVNDKMTQSDMNYYKYNYPEFRYGIICQTIESEKFDFEQAGTILKTFRENQEILKKKLKKCFEHNGITCDFINKEDIEKNKKGFFAELLEGPAVLFEHLKLQINGFDTEFRPSITICTFPSHSKVWMRYSYNKKPFTMNKIEAKQFFDTATNVSKRIAELLVEEYKKILIDNGFSDDLKSIHTIQVKTVSTDDSALKNVISLFWTTIKGNIADNIHKEENSELLKQFEFFASENYSNTEWFGIKTDKAAAIYAKFDKDDLTEFVGIGNNLNDIVTPYNKSVTHKVNIALIKVIAPNI